MNLLDTGLKDPRQCVRVMAALQYARAFGTTHTGPTPLIPAHTDPALATLSSTLAAEQDPMVADALVSALASATKVPNAAVQDLRAKAVDTLALSAGKLAQRQAADFDTALAAATRALYESLQDPALRLSPSTLKEIGGASGDVVFMLLARLGPDLGPDERAALGLLAGQSGRVYYFAAKALGVASPEDFKFDDLARAGDDAAFKRDAARMFVALTSRPFALPKSRYEKK